MKTFPVPFLPFYKTFTILPRYVLLRSKTLRAQEYPRDYGIQSVVKQRRLIVLWSCRRSLQSTSSYTFLAPCTRMADTNAVNKSLPSSQDAEPLYGGYTRFELELEVPMYSSS